jgi:inosine-uridine nucleoside N-ribohydrolase
MNNRRLLGAAFAALLVASACGSSASTNAVDSSEAASGSAQVSIVVDYSPTVSDVAALLYLTQQPNVNLLGVTLAGTGESHCEVGVANTAALLALVDVAQIPVACGPTDPVGPGHEWPADWRKAADELAGLSLPPSDETASEDAVDLLARLAAAAPEPITIVALGPLTNLAIALDRYPAFADDVAMIYTMGGAVDVPGNAPGGQAEWNYYVDPASVNSVLESGIAVTMIPLDATDHVPMTAAWFGLLSDHHTTAAAGAVFDLHVEARPFELGFFFWDELAAAVSLDESLVTLEERAVSIDIAGDSSGRTRNDPNGVVVRIAVDADRARFEGELLTGLNAGAALPAGNTAAGAEVPDAATTAYFETLSEAAEVTNVGIDQLFTSSEGEAFDAVVGDEPDPVLDAEGEETARVFMRAFWVGLTELLQNHRDAMVSVVAPENLTQRHDAMTTAIDALLATSDGQLANIDDLSGEALLGFLWSPNPELEDVESACSDLQAAADAVSFPIQVCPG